VCLGGLGVQYNIRSLWGLYKMHETLWFCKFVLSAGRFLLCLLVLVLLFGRNKQVDNIYIFTVRLLGCKRLVTRRNYINRVVTYGHPRPHKQSRTYKAKKGCGNRAQPP